MKMIPREKVVSAISLSNVVYVHIPWESILQTVENVNKKQGMKKVPGC